MNTDKFRDMQRYSPETVNRLREACLFEALDGRAVLYIDYLKAVEEIERQAQHIAKLIETLRSVVSLRNDTQDCPLDCNNDCAFCSAQELVRLYDKDILAKKGSTE